MSETNLNHHEQALIVDFLYGELDSDHQLLFEQKMQSDPAFYAEVKKQQQLHGVLPAGSQPRLEPSRLEGVHWSLQRKLRKVNKKRNWRQGLSERIGNFQFGAKTQFASIAVAFVLGVVVAKSDWGQQPNSDQLVAQHQQPQAIQLIGDEDFQITDLQLTQMDPKTGKVKVEYSLASKTRLDGNLASEQIQALLATTMMNDVDDSVRLDLADVLSDYTQTQAVRDALSYSLLNDPNPGVRMAAAESLAQLSESESVREVLRMALAKDVNPGVRVEAFQALIEHLEDAQTLELLKTKSEQDSNLYIRDRSRKLVNDMAKSPITKT